MESGSRYLRSGSAFIRVYKLLENDRICTCNELKSNLHGAEIPLAASSNGKLE